MSSSTPLDRFDLYELAVTNPVPLARFLFAAHSGRPRVLREDFSGSGALCRGWQLVAPSAKSIAVDADQVPLRKLAGVEGVRAVNADVMTCRLKADIIAATNFPLGYWHTRELLVAYLEHARRCTAPSGIFACDLYGGSDAFTPGKTSVTLRGPSGERIRYTWEQRNADPITARVFNAIHFHIASKSRGRRAARPVEFRDAFTYDWRLWSIPEMRDAMLDAGWASVDIYDTLGDAIDQDGRVYVRPLEPGDVLDDPYVVYLIARRDAPRLKPAPRKKPSRRTRSARG